MRKGASAGWLIAHWDYLTVYLCESCGGVVGLRPEPCANCARPLTKVEVVPAATLRGAVEALREIASFHEHGKGSAITPAVLAKKAQRALDNLHPGGQ